MGNGMLTFYWHTCGILHWLETELSLFNPWRCSTLWGSGITHTPCPLCMFEVHTIRGLCCKRYFSSPIILPSRSSDSTLSLQQFGKLSSWTCGGWILIKQHFQQPMYSFPSLYCRRFWFLHITVTRSPCKAKNHIGRVENYCRWSSGDHQQGEQHDRLKGETGEYSNQQLCGWIVRGRQDG